MIDGRYGSVSLPKFGKVLRRGIKACRKHRSLPRYVFTHCVKTKKFNPASAADEVVKKIPPQRNIPFTLMNFTPSVACGDSSLTREPWQKSELHFAASKRDQYFVRLCDFKFDARTIVAAGIK